jgi:DNA adenine methylase
MKVFVPPIKIQGIKTKIVPYIMKQAKNTQFKVWIEPFMGSGVVGFNIVSKKAVFADKNPHLVNFYNAIKQKKTSSVLVKEYLESQGELLKKNGGDYYYEVRERFNKYSNPLDFLFLSRSCFNGMIRFNKDLKYNVPYGHKPERFTKAYITKIVNQVSYVEYMIHNNDWVFFNQDFKDTIAFATEDDLIYCDPPYLGRHVDYYDSWDEQQELELKKSLSISKAKFILSTWHSNDFRENPYIKTIWNNYHIITIEHFYHVGAKENNRNPILEALITNFQSMDISEIKKKR